MAGLFKKINKMNLKELKVVWFNLSKDTKLIFWKQLYSATESQNKLNEDAFPNINEWSEFIYGTKGLKDIELCVATEGISILTNII